MNERTISELHDELTTAVRDGDVGRAAKLQSKLGERSPPVGDLVDQFETAVEAGEVEKAKTLTRKISDRLEEKRVEQVETLQRSIHARDQPDISREKALDLQKYIKSMTGASINRAGFLTMASSLLSELEQSDSSEGSAGTDAASSLRQSEQDVDRKKETADSASGTVTLPASVEFVNISSPDPTLSPGQSTTVGVQVTNVGDETARGIEVTVQTRAGLTLNGTTKSIDTLPGGQTATVEFEISARETGTYQVSFDAESGNAGTATRDVAIEVQTDTADLVTKLAGENRQIEFQEVLEAISLYNQDQAVPGTDGQRLDFQDVLRVIALFNREESV